MLCLVKFSCVRVTFYCINLDARLVVYKRQWGIWTWTCGTSATSEAPSSLFHVPDGFAYYVAQDSRQMSREQEREIVYSPYAKLGVLPSTMQGAQKSPMFN